ncbi:hypothetical protein GOP47_0030697, partial [Adiantum capillus-veneris]
MVILNDNCKGGVGPPHHTYHLWVGAQSAQGIDTLTQEMVQGSLQGEAHKQLERYKDTYEVGTDNSP